MVLPMLGTSAQLRRWHSHLQDRFNSDFFGDSDDVANALGHHL